MSFFPQLIAGPIIKYRDICEQINERKQTVQQIGEGIRRFITGLSKKVLIANIAGIAVDNIFAAAPSDINILAAWTATLAYMLQIYFDFSGYSDMAIGLGKMFGFRIPENFDHPYCSKSIREFWRRWHISLSSWFKEYLYIPLGGNRKGRVRTYVNKVIVFFCTGLWHGANWTFVIWGLYHGAFLIIEDIIKRRNLRLPALIKHFYVIVVVCVGFVIFRADTLSKGVMMIVKMFTGFDFSATCMAAWALNMTPLFIVMMIVGWIAAFPVKAFIGRSIGIEDNKILQHIIYTVTVLLLALCIINLSGSNYNPFIYFRF